MKKILIVEDNQSVRESINDIIDSAGYEPKCAENGEKAIQILNSNYTPDLIISDIMMPGIDGYQLRNIISSKPNLAQIPFIFLTAKAQVDEIRKGMNTGADDYITKPFKAVDLLNAVGIRLNKKETLDKKLDIITKNFAMYVPHELRTPLVSILGYTGMLLAERDEISNDEMFYMIERINNSAKRLHDTIEKFILFNEINKSEEDKDYLKSLTPSASINTSKIISDTSSEISKNYNREEDLILNVETADVNMPEILFTTVIKQIIDNAFKFSKKENPVNISSKFENGCYIVLVRDHGIGISNGEIELMDAFVQLERSEQQQIGNGLGLITAKKIMNNFNGKIDIKSVKHEFTEVMLLFPLLEPVSN